MHGFHSIRSIKHVVDIVQNHGILFDRRQLIAPCLELRFVLFVIALIEMLRYRKYFALGRIAINFSAVTAVHPVHRLKHCFAQGLFVFHRLPQRLTVIL